MVQGILANNPEALVCVLIGLGGLMVGVILGLTVMMSSLRKDRKQELRHKRLIYGRCVHCGYDRRGTTSILCPECGK